MSERTEKAGGGVRLVRAVRPDSRMQPETRRREQTPFFSNIPVPKLILSTGEKVETKVVEEGYLSGGTAYRITAPPEKSDNKTEQDQQNTNKQDQTS